MAETIMAGRQIIKKFAGQVVTVFRAVLAFLAKLLENPFISYRPGNAGYRNREQKQVENLMVKFQFFG
ncbi:hypothetical protein SAMN05443429_10921 [Cruoricaptor ignavus]|uniref:Uncharacterized protein n=1 Tax=Cruoricaptor ignavus TaxID=1118202 RepID=A0A1M6GI65_9FLAO|nr:hypothetical protein SAMN05443429_10921 [Cruoricaptor ignavus]